MKCCMLSIVEDGSIFCGEGERSVTRRWWRCWRTRAERRAKPVRDVTDRTTPRNFLAVDGIIPKVKIG